MGSGLKPTIFGFPDLPEQEAGGLLTQSPRLVVGALGLCSHCCGSGSVRESTLTGQTQRLAFTIKEEVMLVNKYQLPRTSYSYHSGEILSARYQLFTSQYTHYYQPGTSCLHHSTHTTTSQVPAIHITVVKYYQPGTSYSHYSTHTTSSKVPAICITVHALLAAKDQLFILQCMHH